jgi:ribonuclease J
MSKNKLRIIPLGGLGEVGRNMMAYEYGGEILVVDAGLMFPENDMLGIDYIIPDMQYLRSKRLQIKGLIITHGHEDHIGSIRHFLEDIQVPVYATPLTRGLIEVKLARQGLGAKADLRTVQAGEVVQIGVFRVELFHVCHSIPDGIGLGIQTPAGLVVHTGDYKFDHTPVDSRPTDFAKLAEFSRRGVLALLSDSTNSERAGWTPSERVIDDALDKVFRQAPGRIIISSFASLVSRMQQVANAAIQHKRKLAFVGPSMVDNAKMARKLEYLDIPDSLLVPVDQALNLPDREVVIMCTGSQGEPSSILGRLSINSYRGFDIQPGDTVVLSSHPIPGNEEIVYRTINRLFGLGANVIYEAIAPVHVSGHASQEEMKLLLNLVRPKFFIPIHGELRQLKRHALLGQELGIPPENIRVVENGQVIELTENEMSLGEKVPAEYVFVDGSGVGDIGPDVMREREELSRDGVISVNLMLDKFTNNPMTEPQILSRGFIMNSEWENIIVQLRRKIGELTGRSSSNSALQKDIEQAVRNSIYSETHRQPVVLVTINRV